MKQKFISCFIIIIIPSLLSISRFQINLNYSSSSFYNKSLGQNEDIKASFTTAYSDNGSAICTAEDTQYIPRMCTDGAGGVIICWIDNRGTPCTIYAQRIDSNGTIIWDANGKLVCSLDDILYYQIPQIISDGKGGAIITYMAERTISKDVYAQRINANGDILWGLNGSTICSAGKNQKNPQIVSNGTGSFIIAWEDFRNGNGDIYAQKIDLNGNPQWIPNGKVVTSDSSYQTQLQMINDGEGGAIIVWEDSRGSTEDIYAQKINSDGEQEWTINGVPICTASNNEYSPQLCSDRKGGAIITWEDYRSGSSYDIYSQRINSEGDINWTYNGIGICTEQGYQFSPQICSDGVGGAIITWEDDRFETYASCNIYAQKIDSEGNTLWINNGTAICTDDGYQCYPQICSDGLNGAIITWIDNRTFSFDIFAQWIDCNGTNQWNIDGNPICTADGFQFLEKINIIDLGSVFITWVDQRNNNSDIYIQKIIYNANPTSNHPGLIRSLIDENKTIDWVLYDDLEGGRYRVLINYQPGNFDVWQDWQPWTKNVELNIKINSSILGTFPYTIEYYDKHEFYGEPDTVIVIIHEDSQPEISFGHTVLLFLLIILILLTFVIKKKIIKK